jgi:micrococcal nuclease
MGALLSSILVSRWRSLVSVVVVLWALVPLSGYAEQFTGKVVGISDGDTISVLREGKAVKVRLHGVDAPEKAQAFGTQARKFTGDLAFQQTVTVAIRDTGRYGRLVGEVLLPDGRSLNQELVRAGMAWWYRQYAPHDTTLAQLEAEARTAKRGLWADAHPVPPWQWRQWHLPA